MKAFFFCTLLIFAFHIKAQQHPVADSIPQFHLKEVNLTPEQKLALKKLIWEYKLEDRKRRRELRQKMFLNLNVRQQQIVRRWWRLRNSRK